MYSEHPPSDENYSVNQISHCFILVSPMLFKWTTYTALPTDKLRGWTNLQSHWLNLAEKEFQTSNHCLSPVVLIPCIIAGESFQEFDLGHRSGRILTWDIVGAVPPDILAIPDVAPFTPIGILPVRSAGKPPSSKNTKTKVRANDKPSIDTWYTCQTVSLDIFYHVPVWNSKHWRKITTENP